VKPRELFIIGPPRSGTTMLARLLGGGAGVLCLSEPFLTRAIMPPWQLNRFFYHFQKSAGLLRRRPPFHGSAWEFGCFLRRMAGDNGFGCLVIKETYRRRGLKSIWHNESLLDELVASRAPVVALIRHPYDVAASTIKLCRWVIGLPGRMIRLRLPNLHAFPDANEVVRWAADNWASYVGWSRRRGLSLIRYEDIVADPRRELKAICRTCHLEFVESMLDGQRQRTAFGGVGDLEVLTRPRPVDQESVGHGQRLTDEQRRIVRDACEPLAGDFDYALSAAPGATDGQAHRGVSLVEMLVSLGRRLSSDPARRR
jgi:hypothetical protein